MEILDKLYTVIKARKNAEPNSSYTASLFAKGNKKIAQKLGEEATETVIAAMLGDKKEIISESADLLFHFLVLLVQNGISLAEISQELERREGISGIDEKQNRNKCNPNATF